MCGIVGYVGQRPVQEILLAGLEKLEYRGYDSAGISIQSDGQLESVRAVGNLSALRAAVDAPRPRRRRRRRRRGAAGHHRHRPHALGHPRPRDRGERPPALRRPTTACTSWSTGSSRTTWSSSRSCGRTGAEFTSETDVEVIAHLIARELDETGDLEAVRRAYNRLRGHYAFVAVAADEPGVLVGARKECPLIVGRGDGEQFLASGIPAFLAHTRDVQYIEDDEIVVLRPTASSSSTADGEPVEREIERDRLGRRGRREGRLRDVHAQGDPRAGGRRGRDDRRPHRAPGRRRPRRSSTTTLRSAPRGS